MARESAISHRGSHLERVETDAASAVDVGVVDGRHEAHLGWFKGIPGFAERSVGRVGVVVSIFGESKCGILWAGWCVERK